MLFHPLRDILINALSLIGKSMLYQEPSNFFQREDDFLTIFLGYAYIFG
jgi:hypothetical protein